MGDDASRRNQICQAAADAVEGAGDLGARVTALAGFDAFIDRIIDVVDQRSAPGDDGYTRIDAIDAFGARVRAAAGRSGNFELVVRREKTGGNAALHAGALASMGASVRFLGAVGESDDATAPHPVFSAFARACRECVCLTEPGQTDALEFDDGKIMLGKPGPLDRLTWERLLDRAGGPSGLRERCAGATVLVFGNWTMHRALDDIWRRLATEVLPALDADARPAMAFVDLADPARRSDDDIAGAMRTLAGLHDIVPVTLGVNLAEARRVASIVGARADLPREGAPAHGALRAAAESLCATLGFRCVVVHGQRRSAAATGDASASFDAPFTQRPVISTGAGDHFNAGFVLASCLGLPLDQRLACASASAGRYVRSALSPTRDDLLAMLRAMPAPEGA